MKTAARIIVSLLSLSLSLVSVSGQDPTASLAPSSIPSAAPTSTETPSFSPSTLSPTDAPSTVPSVVPSIVPSVVTSVVPSVVPSPEPSNTPSIEPSVSPTAVNLSNEPSASPSLMPTTAPSVTPTETPSIDPSVAPSMAPTTMLLSENPSGTPSTDDSSATPSLASIGLILSTSPSQPPTLSANPSQPPSLIASIAPTTTTTLASNNPSASSPSASAIPSLSSSLPTNTNFPTATMFDCQDDPIFTQLEPDSFGNTTDCAWFEYYDFNSCQDFGEWLDPDGNTANQACCVCGGGIPLLPSSAPSQPPTITVVSTPSPTTTRCGCASCSDAVWNRLTTGGASCGERMEFLQSIEGGSVEEEDACYQIAHDEFPDECFPCDSQHCNTSDQHYHCDCPSCTDDIWRRDAGPATCGERVDFLQQQNMGALEACQQIGQAEFPTECGECNPSTCGMSSSSTSRNTPSSSLWMVGTSSALVLLLTLIMV